jgi:hypothetical protein
MIKMSLNDWINSVPDNNRDLAKETISQIWDVFVELDKQGYLKKSLHGEPKYFLNIVLTSNGIFDSFNMLFGIPDLENKFVRGRNKKFVEHNKEFGFTENRYIYLLLSDSMFVFLKNVELFRTSFLIVLKTQKRTKHKVGQKKQQYPFFPEMGIGQLLNALVHTCGKKGEAIKKKIRVDLRNGLAHGLFWNEDWDIVYSKDTTFNPEKIGRIRLDKFWETAFKHSLITQCLIETIPEWYEKSKIWSGSGI